MFLCTTGFNATAHAKYNTIEYDVGDPMYKVICGKDNTSTVKVHFYKGEADGSNDNPYLVPQGSYPEVLYEINGELSKPKECTMWSNFQDKRVIEEKDDGDLTDTPIQIKGYTFMSPKFSTLSVAFKVSINDGDLPFEDKSFKEGDMLTYIDELQDEAYAEKRKIRKRKRKYN